MLESILPLRRNQQISNARVNFVQTTATGAYSIIPFDTECMGSPDIYPYCTFPLWTFYTETYSLAHYAVPYINNHLKVKHRLCIFAQPVKQQYNSSVTKVVAIKYMNCAVTGAAPIDYHLKSEVSIAAKFNQELQPILHSKNVSRGTSVYYQSIDNILPRMGSCAVCSYCFV